VVVALIAGLMVPALLSPVGAGPSVSRKFVRKLVAKRVNALGANLDRAIRATEMNASSTRRVGPFPLTGSAQDVAVAALSIPGAGSYVVTAKLWWNVVNATSTGVGGEIDCDLLAGGSFDTSRESGVTDFDYGTLSLQLTHTFSRPETVILRCRDEFSGGNPVEVHNVVVTAVQVFALGSASLDRGSPSDPPPARIRP
jgi:hypothetical protein